MDLKKYSRSATQFTHGSYLLFIMGIGWILVPLVLILVLTEGDTKPLSESLDFAAPFIMIAAPYLLAGFVSRVSAKRLTQLIAEVVHDQQNARSPPS